MTFFLISKFVLSYYILVFYRLYQSFSVGDFVELQEFHQKNVIFQTRVSVERQMGYSTFED